MNNMAFIFKDELFDIFYCFNACNVQLWSQSFFLLFFKLINSVSNRDMIPAVILPKNICCDIKLKNIKQLFICRMFLRFRIDHMYAFVDLW